MMSRARVAVPRVCLLLLLPLAVSASGTQESAAEQEAMEISWEGRIASGEDTTYSIDWVNEKYNVKIVPNGVGANDGDEKVQLMIASGEFPDVGNYWVDKWELYEEGIIRSISFDMIRKHMPNYARMMDENPTGWLLGLAPDKEDEHIEIMGISASVHGNMWTLPLRTATEWTTPFPGQATAAMTTGPGNPCGALSAWSKTMWSSAESCTIGGLRPTTRISLAWPRAGSPRA